MYPTCEMTFIISTQNLRRIHHYIIEAHYVIFYISSHTHTHECLFPDKSYIILVTR